MKTRHVTMKVRHGTMQGEAHDKVGKVVNIKVSHVTMKVRHVTMKMRHVRRDTCNEAHQLHVLGTIYCTVSAYPGRSKELMSSFIIANA
jgi:hypothetical protein